MPQGKIRRSHDELKAITSTVLSAFTLDGGTYGVTELSHRLGLSKATVHHALTTLVEQGYLKREEARARARARYGLSHRDAEPQNPYAPMPRFRALYVSTMHDFHRVTSERVSVSVRQADRIVFIDRLDACWPIIWRHEVGDFRPLLDWSASSRVVLASLPDLEIDERIRRRVSMGLSKHDPTNGWVERLWRDIEVIRKRGYALSYRAPSPSMISAAFPISSDDNEIQGAIAVGGPVKRFEHRLETALPELKSIAYKLNIKDTQIRF